MEPEEIIEIFQQVLADLERRRQARLAEYRDLATVCFKGRVTVDFDDDCGFDHRGIRAIGSSGKDSIVISTGLSVPAERSVFTHECCHIHLKHSEGPRGAHSNSLKTTVDSLPEGARADFIASIELKETQAHELAKRLHPVLFPGEVYTLK